MFARNVAARRGKAAAVYLDLELPLDVRRFYRTADGAEIDLLFERGGKVEIAFEITRSTTPTLPRGFQSACAALRPKEAFLVYGGIESWPEAEGVAAIGLTAPRADCSC